MRKDYQTQQGENMPILVQFWNLYRVDEAKESYFCPCLFPQLMERTQLHHLRSSSVLSVLLLHCSFLHIAQGRGYEKASHIPEEEEEENSSEIERPLARFYLSK